MDNMAAKWGGAPSTYFTQERTELNLSHTLEQILNPKLYQTDSA